MKFLCQRFAVAFLALLSFPVSATTTHYVDLNSTNPTPPYADWSIAATNIQDAIDASTNGDSIFVTNGVYQTGGRVVPPYLLTNRVVVDKAVVIQSVNGLAVTVIKGNPVPGTNAIRCVYLTNGASLAGFTLTNGATRSWDTPTDNISVEWSGGGAWCVSSSANISNCVFSSNSASYYGGGVRGGTLYHCVLTGNSASYGGGAGFSSLNGCLLIGNSALGGGGVANCGLNNCVLAGNSATDAGGGAESCYTINNCTIVSNSAQIDFGGGVDACHVSNSIVYYNTAPSQPNYATDYLTMNYCCTTPMYSLNQGNFTNEPLFMDLAGGNLRLQSSSPCINSGNNAYVTTTNDLDGNPRIVGGIVDVGAYEYQTPGSILPYVWLLQYGLATDGSADYEDTDGDGMNNLQEWRAGTNPTNALSLLKMLTVTKATNGLLPGLVVCWQGAGGKVYLLQCSTNLAVQSPFVTIRSNLFNQDFGTDTTNYITDATATNSGPYFYRVGVQ